MGAEKLDDLKKCPQCAEMVQSEALVCKHCKAELVEMEFKNLSICGFTKTRIKSMEKKGWTFIGDEQKLIAGTSMGGKILKFKRPKRPGFFARLLGQK